MNRILTSTIFAGLLLGLITTACNLSASEPTALPPSPTASATQTGTLTPSPTATATAAPLIAVPTSEFAPFCKLISMTALPMPQCRFPVVEESSTFCIRKDPYNLILVDGDMTYEVLTEGFRCSDAGKKDGRQMLTCTGPMASHFEINVCDPACLVPTVQATNKKCAEGYNFNSLQGCCTNEIQMLNRNCMVFEFETTSCIVNCREYDTEKLCGKNSYACLWDVQNGFCYERK